jgi:hypothetical protein
VTISDIFVDLGVGRLARLCGCTVKERNERRTVLENASHITLVDSLLKDAVAVGISGPTVDEISVHAITGCIALSKDPCGSIGVEGEVLNFVDDLVEQHRQVDGVRRGTGSAIDTSGWPGHVGSVVRGVQVLSIPARTEINLSAHT